MAEDETLYIPGEDEDVRAVALVVKDGSGGLMADKMWVDGRWQAYDEDLWDQIENDELEEEEEEQEEKVAEVEEEVEEDLEMESDVSFIVVREYTEDESDADE
jgi:hypothetical protein